MKKGIIILASSRSHGDTFKAVSYLRDITGFEIVDLSQKDIGHYDYEFKNKNDDFNYLFKGIVQNYKTLVFATPVYWYTMSGIMKTFLDRISDFLNHEKDYGRMLRGKNMAVISCSNDHDCPGEFNLPFLRSASYLGMNYLGDMHSWIHQGALPEEVKEKINAFALTIKN